MAEIVPVDVFLDGWYPGWKPEHIDEPWLRMRSDPSARTTSRSFWFVDFHWPRGFSPLGFHFVSVASLTTQLAAHQLPLPPAGGLVQRMGGPFLYEGEVPVTSPWEIGFRAARIEKNMPKFLGSFDDIWEERKWELELGLTYFESYDFAGKSLAEIGQYLADAMHLPAAGLGDPLRDHVPAARHLPAALRAVRVQRGRPRQHRQDAAGSRLQDHGDRPGDVGPGRRGQAPRHRRPVRPRARADPRRAVRRPAATRPSG